MSDALTDRQIQLEKHKELQAEITNLTKMLCGLLSSIDRLYAESPFDGVDVPGAVQIWWKKQRKVNLARAAAKRLKADEREALLAYFKLHGKLP